MSEEQGAGPRTRRCVRAGGLGGEPVLLQERLVLDSSWTAPEVESRLGWL